jgi:hypothetical protein
MDLIGGLKARHCFLYTFGSREHTDEVHLDMVSKHHATSLLTNETRKTVSQSGILKTIRVS